jgi:hypothetical protein
MKATIHMAKKSASIDNKVKSLRVNIKEYQDLMLNDGFLRGDNYYAIDAMFINNTARKVS